MLLSELTGKSCRGPRIAANRFQVRSAHPVQRCSENPPYGRTWLNSKAAIKSLNESMNPGYAPALKTLGPGGGEEFKVATKVYKLCPLLPVARKAHSSRFKT